jgi:hypothetical protein
MSHESALHRSVLHSIVPTASNGLATTETRRIMNDQSPGLGLGPALGRQCRLPPTSNSPTTYGSVPRGRGVSPRLPTPPVRLARTARCHCAVGKYSEIASYHLPAITS